MIKSLRGKLILFTTILVVVVMLTITYLFTFREIESRLDDVETQMRRIAQNIATMQLLDRQEWEIYQNYISQLMAFNTDIVYIAIYDSRGNLRAHTLNTDWLELDRPITSRRTQADVVRQLDRGAISAESIDDLRTEVVNIQVGDRVLGSVNVGFSVIEINDRLREHVLYVIILSFIFLFIFISISILHSRRLTRPLEKLTQAMRKIDEGHFDQKVEPETQDEIGQLSQSFNKMVEGLKERQIIDDLGHDLGATFQLSKLSLLVRDSLRDAIGAKTVRLYLRDDRELNTYREITTPDSEDRKFPPIHLSEKVDKLIISETNGFMIHDAISEVMQSLNHSPDDDPGLIMPMMVKDQLFGMLFFALPDHKNSYTDKERRFAATLSSQVALALENAVLYEQLREQERIKRELEIAREVQQQLLPAEMPTFDGFSIQGICRSAFEVGGDYFDFFPLEQNKLGIVIADVSGKGTSASFYMAELKGLMMQLASDVRSPKDLLINLNKKLFGNIDRQSFISMIYGVVDNSGKTFTFSRAGHNSILKLGKNGDYSFITPKGIGLGLAVGDKFNKHLEETSISFEKNDVLVFYTDGITEAMNEQKEEYGEERLLDVCKVSKDKNVTEMQNEILGSVDNFIGASQAHDDQTMIIVKCLD
jgi:serine phosphatase RsbU (regulator of sigma subunit)/HAMP domain-containing protein